MMCVTPNFWSECSTHDKKRRAASVTSCSSAGSTAEWQLLRQLYEQLRWYKNFFQPAMKLKEKVREGGKIHRRYDTPQTPYQRLLESGQVSAAARAKLKRQYEALRVGKLRRRIEQLRDQLFDAVESKEETSVRRRGRGRPIRAAWSRKQTAQAA